jgi:hypothetical protein
LLIKDFNNGIPRIILRKKYKICHQSLYNYIAKDVREIHTRSDSTLIHNYFSKIDSEIKAYWLGFIFADGNISQKKYGYVFRIGVAMKDKEHIQSLFKDELKTSNIPWTDKNTNVIHFNVHSKQLYEDLKALGCIPAKTLKLKFPNLPKKYLHHFIRGYFDGDGCITTGPSVEFIGTKHMLNAIQKELGRHDKMRSISKSGKVVCFWIGGRNMVKNVYEYLYKEATVYLPRKKFRFEELLGLSKTQVA